MRSRRFLPPLIVLSLLAFGQSASAQTASCGGFGPIGDHQISAGQNVYYDVNISNGSIYFGVDWGDGTADRQTIYGGPYHFSHVYPNPGSYYISLTIYGTLGNGYACSNPTDYGTVMVGGGGYPQPQPQPGPYPQPQPQPYPDNPQPQPQPDYPRRVQPYPPRGRCYYKNGYRYCFPRSPPQHKRHRCIYKRGNWYCKRRPGNY